MMATKCEVKKQRNVVFRYLTGNRDKKRTAGRAQTALSAGKDNENAKNFRDDDVSTSVRHDR